MKLDKHSSYKTAAIFLTVVAAVYLLINIFFLRDYLVLQNDITEEVYGKFYLPKGEKFSVEFIHSVNQSLVEDFYEVRSSEIYVVETIYYHFGAGVQTEILDGQQLVFLDNGAMKVTNINQHIPYLSYMVGKWSDHILRINGKYISLTKICGRGTKVHFKIQRSIF